MYTRLNCYSFLIFCSLYIFCECNPLIGFNIREANKNEFPFVVSISYPNFAGIENNEKYHKCGGSLITRKHVLTSAHCKLDVTYVSDIVVEVGSNDLRKTEHYKVKYWVPYNAWATKKHKDKRGENDISIIKLKEKVSADIPLAVISNRRSIDLYGTEATTVGWGVTNNGPSPSRYLMVAKFKITSREKCSNTIRQSVTDIELEQSRFLCTESLPDAVLQCGDSGGPLIINGNEIIGINDSACPTEDNQYIPEELNIHLGVDYYREFITDITRKKKFPFGH